MAGMASTVDAAAAAMNTNNSSSEVPFERFDTNGNNYRTAETATPGRPYFSQWPSSGVQRLLGRFNVVKHDKIRAALAFFAAALAIFVLIALIDHLIGPKQRNVDKRDAFDAPIDEPVHIRWSPLPRCLESGALGEPVITAPCRKKEPKQLWVFDVNGGVRNRGKCLTYGEAEKHLTTMSCHNNMTGDQQWVYVAKSRQLVHLVPPGCLTIDQWGLTKTGFFRCSIDEPFRQRWKIRRVD